MPPTEAAAATTSTTLTAPRQSSQQLQLLRLVLQGSIRELRRYLARRGDPNARVYHSVHADSFHVSGEEYTGPGEVLKRSLLAICCLEKWSEQIALLIDAGADVNSDLGTSLSPLCTAACMGDIATMVMLETEGAHVDSSGDTPLMAASAYGRLEAAKWLVDHGADVSAAALASTRSGGTTAASAMLRAATNGHVVIMRYLHL